MILSAADNVRNAIHDECINFMNETSVSKIMMLVEKAIEIGYKIGREDGLRECVENGYLMPDL